MATANEPLPPSDFYIPVPGNLGRPGTGFLYLNGSESRGIDEEYLAAPHLAADPPDPISHMELAACLEDPARSQAPSMFPGQSAAFGGLSFGSVGQYEKLRGTATVELDPNETPGSGATPEQEAVRREEHGRVWAVLRRLPARQREVFVLRHLEGFTTNDVAALLGIASGSVKRHLFRAVHALRRALGEPS